MSMLASESAPPDWMDGVLASLRDPSLTKESKRELYERYLPAAKSELERLQTEVGETTFKIKALEQAAALEPWLREPPRIERNDCSRLHRLVEAAREGMVAGNVTSGERSYLNDLAPFWHTLHPFVVKHDWRGSFGDALGDVGNDYRLPFDSCAFEFRISGRNVIVLAWEAKDQSRAALPFVEADGLWLMYGEQATELAPLRFAWEQIQAISVALDARVATHEVTRAPAALNRKREAAGRVKMYDFHVVDLSRRTRAAPAVPNQSDRRSPRLHFRRGHWRHFDTRKTWINWMLVGDPELGFIGKHYSL